MRVLLLTLIMLGVPITAQAAAQCAPRAGIVDFFAKNYGERPVAAGLQSGGGVMELLVSDDGSTWTLLVSTPQGVTCFVSSGTAWVRITPSPTDPGS